MESVADQSVHLVVTSPPYWQLKDYGDTHQIGYHENYESYINNLNLVWKECYRILENGCRLCVNIGDQFARSVYYGRYKVIPIRTEIIKFCETIGFDYMGAIIWQKKTTMNTTGGASIMGSFPFPRNGIVSIDYEFILLFKKPGKPVRPNRELKEQSKLTQKEWKEYFSGHWYFGGAKQGGHIAVFPEELPKRLIKMFTFVGDIVVDPFLGSGTTSLAAQREGRNSIGYEINPEFLPFIREKLGTRQIDITTQYEFIPQQKLTLDFEQAIRELPYVFTDPHGFDKKIDPKKLRFGSKIDRKSPQREEYYTIKEIISPELIRLNNDLIVRLIGIKEDVTRNGDAIEFLKKKTRGQRVFLKYDNVTHDEHNHRLCYMYLKNKTFINSHLIKHGFVNIDTSYEYKDIHKFLALRNNKD